MILKSKLISGQKFSIGSSRQTTLWEAHFTIQGRQTTVFPPEENCSG